MCIRDRGHSRIGRQRNSTALENDGLFGERILEYENASPALELCDYGDPVGNSRRREVLVRVLVRFAFDGHARRADPIASGPLSYVFTADVELIGRCELVRRARDEASAGLGTSGTQMDECAERQCEQPIESRRAGQTPVHLAGICRPALRCAHTGTTIIVTCLLYTSDAADERS